jgi:acyl-coenzyme A synthetase/AMP-(fatty) acid ligase
VVFTSGSTGPAKGVVYRHRQVECTRDLLSDHYAITHDDVLVAAFAPWAVLGPALGIASVLPDMDVTSPRTLTATALADAVGMAGGSLIWASPAALANVMATSSELTPHQRDAFSSLRLVLAAGAPVPVSLLRSVAELCPHAEARTPYGMTEALPVCDVTLDEIEAAGPGDGVLVGSPLPGVDVRISAVEADGTATAPLSDAPDVMGEIVVRGAHIRDHYDRLWATQRASARDAGWHRTGDVGQLDDSGRLWIGGRLAHVVTAPEGPIAPVGVEQRVEALPGVAAAACVGVGPVGTQAVIVIVVTRERRIGLADLTLADGVRDAAGVPVAAVLERRELPVDIRHNSKVDRTSLALWAAGVLAGRGTA